MCAYCLTGIYNCTRKTSLIKAATNDIQDNSLDTRGMLKVEVTNFLHSNNTIIKRCKIHHNNHTKKISQKTDATELCSDAEIIEVK